MALEVLNVKRYGNGYSERSTGFYERFRRCFFFGLWCCFYTVLQVR